MKAAFVLLVVTLLAHLPAWRLTSWTGTEGRRVEIVREMSATGDLLVPTLGLEPTLAKPPLYYWVLTAFERTFGLSIWSMRAPSVLSWWAVALLAYLVLRRSHDEVVGWIGALGILCSPVLIHHGAVAEIDPLFSACTAASVLLLGHAVGFRDRRAFVAAGLLGGLALLTKGPPYFLFLAGPLLAWWRRRGEACAPMLGGLAWLLPPMLTPPAVVYVLMRSRLAGHDIAAVAQEETVARLTTYEWHHVLDIPMHFVRAALILLPFAMFVFAEFRGMHEARLRGAALQQRFCTTSAAAAVLLLAVFPGHAVRYLLPAVVLFICGVAPRVAGWVRFPAPPGPIPLRVLRGLGIVGALGILVLPWLAPPLPGRSFYFAVALAVVPLWITTRAHVLGYILMLPVLAAWTVLQDRGDRYEHGVRSSAHVAGALHEALRTRSVDTAELSTWGHFTYSLAFDLPHVLRGDERMRETPTTRWLLVEHRGDQIPRPTGYVDRARVRGRDRDIVLLERTE